MRRCLCISFALLAVLHGFAPRQVCALATAGEEDGEREKRIAACTRVIEAAGSTPARVAEALIDRGVAYGQMGDTVKEIEDYSRAIEMKDAPAGQLARALVF